MSRIKDDRPGRSRRNLIASATLLTAAVPSLPFVQMAVDLKVGRAAQTAPTQDQLKPIGVASNARPEIVPSLIVLDVRFITSVTSWA